MTLLFRPRALDIAVLAFGLSYACLVLTPLSFWYDMGEVVVLGGRHGQPVELEYHGGAVREFLGSYSVVVREFETREIVCEATSGAFTYEVDAQRPDPLTMAWWAPSDPRCSALAPGTYVMETCWTVHKPFGGLVPAKNDCISSRDFTIRS